MQGFRFYTLIAASALALAACSPPPAPVLGADGQPTGQTVQQGSNFLSNFGAAMAGSAVGSMLFGNRGGGSGYASAPPVVHNSTVVNKTVVNKTIVVRPPVVATSPSVQPPKPTTTRQSYSRSGYSSGSYSGSSARNSSSRSSFGGRR